MDKFILSPITLPELQDLIKASIREALGEQAPAQTQADTLLSLSEAALFLKIAEATLYGYTSARKIPFLKKGKKLYFRRAELEAWLQSGRRKTVSEIEKEAATFTSKKRKV